MLLFLQAVIVATLSSYFTYIFAIKSKKNEAMLKFKEEKYTNLLLALQGFMNETTSTRKMKNFIEEQYKSWIYCSDDVVLAINKFINSEIENKDKTPDQEEYKKVVGNVVLEMRKDLKGSTKLTYKDFKYTNVIER